MQQGYSKDEQAAHHPARMQQGCSKDAARMQQGCSKDTARMSKQPTYPARMSKDTAKISAIGGKKPWCSAINTIFATKGTIKKISHRCPNPTSSKWAGGALHHRHRQLSKHGSLGPPHSKWPKGALPLPTHPRPPLVSSSKWAGVHYIIPIDNCRSMAHLVHHTRSGQRVPYPPHPPQSTPTPLCGAKKA